MTKLGENIKYLRKRQQWYQRDLASKLNISRSTLAKYETGERVPDLHVLIKMADLFGVSLDELSGRPEKVKDVLTEVRKRYHAKEEVSEDMLHMISFIQKNDELKESLSLLSALPHHEQKKMISILKMIVS